MAGEMVAFTNADGGCVFLGVDDAGIVRGLAEDRLEDIERWAINIASNTCVPPVRPILRKERLTSDDLVHPQQIAGTVDRQIDEATEFVERFMLKPARKPGGREDFPQYSTGVVHEAIVNAVAHRDYSIAGSKIRLFLFADRMEIYSPGGLPNTITLETMPYRVFTRNQLLVSLLSRMKSRRTGRAFLESRGEGVRRILEEGERHAGRRPVYELFGEELRLTIWAKPSPHEGRAGE